MPRKKATIKDIAAAAGVTATSVSNALNNRPGLSQKTRKKIVDIADKLGYQPDLVARSLINRKSQTIGLLINNVKDPFFSVLVEDIESAARQHGYAVIICNVNNEPELEQKYINMLIGKRVDGIIISSVKHKAPHIRTLVEDEFPFVLVNRRVYDPEIQDHINTVVLNNFEAAYQAVTHLYKLGHDRIAILTGYQKASTIIERTQGAIAALQDHGLQTDPGMIIECRVSEEETRQAIEYLMAMDEPPTAIFAEDDIIALWAREALLGRGVKIPEDVALIGFDNIRVSGLTGVDLSSIWEKKEAMAEVSVALLMDVINRADNGAAPIQARQIVLETELVIRKSCGFYKTGYAR